MSHSTSFTEILKDLNSAEHGKSTAVGDIVQAFEYRGFGPLLMVPSLLVLIPVIGAIPGVSIIGAAIIILITGQMVIGRKSPWIPKAIERIQFNGNKLEKGVNKTKPVASWLDKYTSERLAFLTTDSMKRVCAVLCLLLALLLVPLAAVPMGVTIPAAAIFFFALALTVNDGVLMLLALLVTLAAFYGAYYWLM